MERRLDILETRKYRLLRWIRSGTGPVAQLVFKTGAVV